MRSQRFCCCCSDLSGILNLIIALWGFLAPRFSVTSLLLPASSDTLLGNIQMHGSGFRAGMDHRCISKVLIVKLWSAEWSFVIIDWCNEEIRLHSVICVVSVVLLRLPALCCFFQNTHLFSRAMIKKKRRRKKITLCTSWTSVACLFFSPPGTLLPLFGCCFPYSNFISFGGHERNQILGCTVGGKQDGEGCSVLKCLAPYRHFSGYLLPPSGVIGVEKWKKQKTKW